MKAGDKMDNIITNKDVELIVEQVLNKLQPVIEAKNTTQVEKFAAYDPKNNSYDQGENGIFNSVEAAVEASYNAQTEFIANYKLEDRNRIIEAIRNEVLNNNEKIAQLVYEETGLGRYEDKVSKINLAALKTPGTEDIKTSAISGDNGLMIEEMAPFGVIGAVTPVTNPVETLINNSISMIAGGNSVVFNVHPSSKQCSAFAVQLINNAIIKANGPKNLVAMIQNPTIETVNELTKHPKIRMMVGTGGPSLVKSLLSSGKKTVGAGAGNPPVIVDETADIQLAAKGIIEGASFDNNILCIAEKEAFVVRAVADDLIYHMLQNGAYMLNRNELERVMNLTLVEDEVMGAKSCTMGPKKEYHVHKEWIGKDAAKILNAIGVNKPDVRLIICEVDSEHPYVTLEQMMPVMPIVRCENVDEAIKLAVKAERGNRHTASIFSQSVEHMTKFARAINTTIFVKNAPTLAGVGYKGEGSTTFTIAGPTGEGITSAKTFTRVRRCVLAEGGFRIV
jgi:propionaldehyde dehydrogenase